MILKDGAASKRARSLWQDALLHILRDRLTMAALVTLVLLTAICYIVPPLVENSQVSRPTCS